MLQIQLGVLSLGELQFMGVRADQEPILVGEDNSELKPNQRGSVEVVVSISRSEKLVIKSGLLL